MATYPFKCPWIQTAPGTVFLKERGTTTAQVTVETPAALPHAAFSIDVPPSDNAAFRRLLLAVAELYRNGTLGSATIEATFMPNIAQPTFEITAEDEPLD